MARLPRLLFGVWLLGLSVSVMAACGDDDASPSKDAGPHGGAGHDGGGERDGGGSGASGKGGAGSGAGDGGGGDVTEAQCLQQVTRAAPDACIECTCAADPSAAVACDEPCWEFLLCVTDACGGDFTDGDCLNDNCPTSLGSSGTLTAAMVLGPAYAKCGAKCTAGGEEDAGGVDQDAGQD